MNILKQTRYDIKKVVVILSASRAGSSLLFDIMKRFPYLYYLQGESVPFLKKHYIISNDSRSEIVKIGDVEDTKFDKIGEEILNNLGKYNDDYRLDTQDKCQMYVHQLYERFQLQWPLISFEEQEFKKLTQNILKNHLKKYESFDLHKFYIELLTELVKEYEGMNPYYYDLPLDMLQTSFPDIPISSSPPNQQKLIEEPPFILIKPWQSINSNIVDDYILLMKTPGNSYRMEFIREIFPNATFQFIYLTRNPASSINGLYDGWLYRGFYSYNLKKQLSEGAQPYLNIKGYSEKYWWNFDLPPGWEKYINSSLEEVCAYQYYQNNNHIYQYLSNSRNKYIKIKFEDIIDPRRREDALNRILEFLSQKTTIDRCMDTTKLPIVQASRKPRLMRWKEREEKILPIIYKPEFRDLMNKMGYFVEKKKRWL